MSQGGRLTPRQLEVLELRAQGCSVGEAAAALGLSENTAGKHCENAFRRLGVGTLVEALAAAGITASGGTPEHARRSGAADELPPVRVDVPVGGGLVATVTVRVRRGRVRA